MPTTQTQIRRDTATNINAATPTAGELAWDTTNELLRVGNGSTAGGIYQASAKGVQNNSFTYATAGGSANALTLTLTPAPASYAAGQEFTFKAASSNTTATTINVNSLGAKNIYKMSAGVLTALAANDIISGGIYTIYYDGTQFQLSGGASSGGVVAVKRQTFTANGTYTPSTGMLYADVEVLGGGGGGGYGLDAQGSAGGGGGGYARELISAATIGASQSVTIGAGGAGGTAGNDGSAGGTTSLGILISATGGSGGEVGGASRSALGGAGGSGSGGDVNASGQVGGNCSNHGSGNITVTGSGGNSIYGQGGQGVRTSATGNNASGYGAGGGGSRNGNGGNGTSGIIIITEFCSVA